MHALPFSIHVPEKHALSPRITCAKVRLQHGHFVAIRMTWRRRWLNVRRRWLDRCKRTMTTELTTMFVVNLGAQKRGGFGLSLSFWTITYCDNSIFVNLLLSIPQLLFCKTLQLQMVRPFVTEPTDTLSRKVAYIWQEITILEQTTCEDAIYMHYKANKNWLGVSYDPHTDRGRLS